MTSAALRGEDGGVGTGHARLLPASVGNLGSMEDLAKSESEIGRGAGRQV